MGRARLSTGFLLLAVAFVAASPRQTPDGSITFRLYVLGREAGRETDTFSLVSGGRRVDATFAYTERGTEVSLTGSIETTADWSPKHLIVRGRTSANVSTDSEVTVDGTRVHVRDGQRTADLDISGKPFFPVDSYAPVALQEQLLRYWRAHARPRELASAPGGTVRIERRADEQIDIGDRTISLERVAIEGPAWGRETAWIEGGGGLAAVTTWTGGVPFQAVRQGYEGRMDRFLDQAIRDRMVDLERLGQQNPPDQSGAFALVGATVIDGTRKPPIQDATVIVRGDHIDAVGLSSRVRPPSDMPKIDVRGMTIVAGLWDMHAHASQIDWAPLYLASGVTSVRDMGGETPFLTAFRDTLAGEEGFGPRLLLAGAIDGPGPEAFGTVFAATAEDGRQAVRRYRTAGIRQISLYRLVPPAVAKAIVLEAHRLSMMVAGRVPNGMTPDEALQAGFDQIVDVPVASTIDASAMKALLALFVQRRASLDPILAADELRYGTPPASMESFRAAMARLPVPLARTFTNLVNPPGDAAAVQARRQTSLQFVRDAVRAGVKVVAGSNQGIPGFSLQRELELYVEGGLTPLEAIQSATVVPAQVMKLDDSGTVEAGKRADLIVLTDNPLANISNLRTAKWVVANGKLYDCTKLWKAAGFQ
jgi:imidazolonepropionase-like amidohydrolase